MKRFFLCLFIVFSLFLNAKESIILDCRHGAGMFSIWMDVLSLCRSYDKGNLKGIEVDFAMDGLYYSPGHGSNWWNYFCEPIKHGNLLNARRVRGDIPGSGPGVLEFVIERKEARRLIKKYIHIRPELRYCIDEFYEKHFKGKFVLCVHYRGLDKYTEAPKVPYNKVFETIQFHLLWYGNPDYKIFVATDDELFLDFMITIYGDRVCFQNAFRSTGNTGIHYIGLDGYQLGKEALIDMVLLSKGDHLIRMSSNLSKWSTWWNPNIPVTDLNQRYGY